ncbi:MAG: hypoxanthine phosphoribosyltransferase [Propionibacteriaceae bacterium]|nr:hypoxanthine phosphoribosyltransferase [Propionibacteriaceae bacterium]
MDSADVISDLSRVLYQGPEIQRQIARLAAQIDDDYAGLSEQDLILVGVLNGAVMVMADLSRSLKTHCQMEWMAISSYGSGTTSSGVLRILKDLSVDIAGRHVLVVEDIIDTGLTLSYLIDNLRSRGPASVEVMTAFRKPEASKCPVDVKYVGFDIPADFVVGYGLDYAGRYRNLTDLGVLDPKVYTR